MLIVLSPMEYPMAKNEKWFYVHPNNQCAEFFIPAGAAAVCLKPLLGKFKKSKPYRIVNFDDCHGWLSVELEPNGDIYKMPIYLFARHFDAEAFVRPVSINRFDYKYHHNYKTWSD